MRPEKLRPNLAKRIYATLFDYGLFILIQYTLLLYFGNENDSGGLSISGYFSIVPVVIWIIYFIVFETINDGTPGHNLFNLAVQVVDGSKIGFTNSFLRHILDPIDIFMYGIPAIIAIKNSEKHQRLGDMLANTIVVDMKDPLQFPQTIQNVET